MAWQLGNEILANPGAARTNVAEDGESALVSSQLVAR
jgi:hypothetical protein